MVSNIERTIQCLERAIEVVKKSQHSTRIHIEVNADIDSIPTLEYDIEELAPYKEKEE